VRCSPILINSALSTGHGSDMMRGMEQIGELDKSIPQGGGRFLRFPSYIRARAGLTYNPNSARVHPLTC